MPKQVGHLCKLYVSAATESGSGYTGTGASEVTLAKDVDWTFGARESDETDRSHGGWEGKFQGLKNWGCKFDMTKQNTDTAYLILRNAFINGTPIAVRRTGSGTATGTYDTGAGYGFVTQFDEPEVGGERVATSVTISGTGAWIIS